MPEHDVIPLGERHAIHNWEYADATARLAATGFIPADVTKWAKQLDDGTYWELTDDSPITWAQRTGVLVAGSPFELEVACSDLDTPLTAVTAQMTFPWPRAVTLISVHAFLVTPQTSGSVFTIDINEGGVSILSTKITIDNGEPDSTTAATQPVISDASLAAMARITVDIDQIGDGTAAGLYLVFIGTRV